MSTQYTECPKETIVRQMIKAQAQISIKPNITHGQPKVYCLNSDISPNNGCHNHSKYYPYPTMGQGGKPGGNKCTFTLTQLLCVEIPIEFDVDVDIAKGISCCGEPKIGPCVAPQKEWYCEYGVWKIRDSQPK